jgi:hypothetical protein
MVKVAGYVNRMPRVPVVLVLSPGADHIHIASAEKALSRRGVPDPKRVLTTMLAAGHKPVHVPRCESVERLINELRSAGVNARLR